jgi:TRAP-type C4-dicarboxylate transport system permease small subunit
MSEWLLLVAKGIVGGAAFVANLCLIGILVIIFTNVVLRYIIRTPLYWGDEAVINLMIVMVYAAFGHVLIEGGHVRMTILFERLPGRVQNILWILVSLLGTAYASFLLYAVIQLVLDSLRIGSFSMITRWPIAPWQMLVALGLFCLLVAFIILVTTRVGIALGTRKTEQAKEKEGEVLY